MKIAIALRAKRTLIGIDYIPLENAVASRMSTLVENSNEIPINIIVLSKLAMNVTLPISITISKIITSKLKDKSMLLDFGFTKGLLHHIGNKTILSSIQESELSQKLVENIDQLYMKGGLSFIDKYDSLLLITRIAFDYSFPYFEKPNITSVLLRDIVVK